MNLIMFVIALLLPIMVILMPIGLVVVLLRKSGKPGNKQAFTVEEARLMQEIHRSLDRMERRVEHLETIVLETGSHRLHMGSTR